MMQDSSPEDDIDIEEHDVLDNPRIRSIFPDLSRVKIEIQDNDDDVVVLDDPQHSENSNPTSFNQDEDTNYGYFNIRQDSDQDPPYQDTVPDNSDNDPPYQVTLPSNSDQDIPYEEHVPNSDQDIPFEECIPSNSDQDIPFEECIPSNSDQDIPFEEHIPSNSDQDIPFEEHIPSNSDQDIPYEEHIPSNSDQDIPYEEHIPSNSEQDTLYQDTVPETVNRDGLYQEHLDSTSDQEPEERTTSASEPFYFGNAIILGSKPTVDYDILYQEALNSNVLVSLEDWGDKLQNSPCYCQDCGTLFPTGNALDAHKMISHSYLVALEIPHANTARKSTGNNPKSNSANFSKYCNHCSKMFPDDTALIKHLYELLPLNNFDSKPSVATPQKAGIVQKPQIKKTVISPTNDDKVDLSSIKKTLFNVHLYENVKFKCIICKKIFLKYDDARRHKKIHPGTYNRTTILKITSKNSKAPIPDKKPHKNPQKVAKTPVFVVPKPTNRNPKAKGKFFCRKIVSKVMFQCQNCHIHFLSSFAAIAHSRNCLEEDSKSYKKCDICKRKIRSRDSKLHTLQHKSLGKLKIYTAQNGLFEKVLCKCPNCETYFDELGFWTHFEAYEKCTDATYQKCNICNIKISQKRYKPHMQKHTVQKCTKKDFILIDFVDLEVTKVKKSKFNNFEGKMLYYCDYCDCFINRLTSKCHLEKQCLEPSMKKRFCYTCGLRFTDKSYIFHLQKHEKQQFNLKETKFINLRTGTQIELPLPKYIPCQKCKIHFTTLNAIRRHNCMQIAYRKCNICVKKFDLTAHKLHMNFHVIKNELLVPKTEDLEIPELLKKYNSINTNMWNVIYMCGVCELATDSYDSAVVHSQNHINGINEISEICEKCDFDFLKDSYMNHQKLHSTNSKINKNSFQVLTYDYKDLFKGTWVDILKQLPESHRTLILSRSLYRYRRNIKMNVAVSSDTDEVKYYCLKCLRNIPPISLDNHLTCEPSSSFTCLTCQKQLPYLEALIQHENQHDSVKKTYKIVTINNKKDSKFNDRLLLFENRFKPVDVKDEVSLASNDDDNSTIYLFNVRLNRRCRVKCNRFKYFKCALCASCITSKFKTPLHNACVYIGADRQFCNICKEYFLGCYPAHKNLHEKFHNLHKNDFKFILFNDSSEVSDTALVKNETNTVKIEPYDQDNAIEDAEDILVVPVIDKNIEKVDPENKNAYIFKCVCGLHYTSKKTIVKHIELECSRDIDISQESCSKCQLLFPTDVLVTHLCNHHSKKMNIVVNEIKKLSLIKCDNCGLMFHNNYDLSVHACDTKYSGKCARCRLTYGNKSFRSHRCSYNTIFVITTKSIEKVAYKCTSCNTCYLNKKTRDAHRQINHSTRKKTVTCNICRLNFTAQSIAIHKSLHHKNNSNEFEVVEFDADNAIESPHEEIKPNRKRKFDEIDTDVSVKNKRGIHTDDSEVSDDEISIDNDNSDNDYDVSEKSENVKQKISINDYNKTIYKCPDCRLHFMKYNTLWYHVRKEKHVTDSQYYTCEACGLDFSRNSMLKHKYLHHETMNLELKDLIIESPLESISAMKAIKSENEINENNESTNENDESRVKTRESTSKITFKDDNSDLSSLEDETTSQVSSQKSISDDYRKKVTDHLSVNNYSRNLFKCADCNLHFLNDRTLLSHLANHRRNTEEFKCEKCGLAFTKASLIRHEFIHHKKMRLKLENFYIIETPTAVLLSKNKIYKNVKPVKKSKIVLHRCPKCHCHFFNKKSCQKHIFKHFNNVPIRRIHRCNICNLAFNSYYLSEHIKLHHRRKKLGVNDFLIQDCHESNSAESEENEMETKPVNSKTETQLDNSKKLNNILYKCIKCDTHFLNRKSLYVHDLLRNHSKVDTSKCDACGLWFSNESLKRHKYIHHMQKKLSTKDFVIEKSTGVAKKTAIERRFTNQNKLATVSQTQDNTLFKCTDCKIHFSSPKAAFLHLSKQTANLKPVIIKCKQCGLGFSKKSIINHIDVHHINQNLSLKDLVIQQKFDHNTEPKSLLLTYSKYQKFPNKTKVSSFASKIVFETDDDIETGVASDTKTPDSDVKTSQNAIKDVVSEISDTDNEVLSKKLEPSARLKSILETGNYNNCLYKCSECDIHFLFYKSLNTHISRHGLIRQRDTPEMLKIKCTYCGLTFLKNSYIRHKYVHHDKMKLQLKDFIISTLDQPRFSHNTPIKTYKSKRLNPENSTQPTASSTAVNPITPADRSSKKVRKPIQLNDKDRLLYKCDKCKLHYLNKTTLEHHMTLFDHSTEPEYANCKICHFDFSKGSLHRHVSIQHNFKKMKREDFRIVFLKDSDSQIEEENKSHNVSIEAISIDENAKSLESQSDSDSDDRDPNSDLKSDPLGKSDPLVNLDSDPKVNTVGNSELVSPNYIVPDDLNSQKNIIYHKCHTCNVYFLNRKECMEHCTDHRVLNSIMYINCKICDFQFLIESLKDHVLYHHATEFQLQNVIVNEYYPMENLPPKIVSYRASDKVQSGLISTTTDNEILP